MRKPSALLLLSLVVIVLIGPLLLPIDPLRTEPEAPLQPPSHEHLFGTDLLGRDVFSRVLHGGRITLSIASLSTALALVTGTLVGGAAGIWPNHVGRAVTIGLSALLAIPGLITALVVVTLIGRGGLSLVLALAVTQMAPVAYMTRTAMVSVRSETYIEAAIGLGAPSLHNLWEHILPNIQPVLLAYTGVVFSYTLLNGAALSFLGVGNEPGIPDWGVMLAEGRASFRTAPWVSIAPGIAITLLVWAVNDLADHIRR